MAAPDNKCKAKIFHTCWWPYKKVACLISPEWFCFLFSFSTWNTGIPISESNKAGTFFPSNSDSIMVFRMLKSSLMNLHLDEVLGEHALEIENPIVATRRWRIHRLQLALALQRCPGICSFRACPCNLDSRYPQGNAESPPKFIAWLNSWLYCSPFQVQ